MAKRSSEEVGVNMTPMIDIVFQLIIFFIVTITMDNERFLQEIKLAKSEHGPAIEKKDPLTIVVEVDEKGRLYIAQTPMSEGRLRSILQQSVNRWGSKIPLQIRGDLRTKHEDIRKVLEACGAAGIWKVSFVALKEQAEQG